MIKFIKNLPGLLKSFQRHPDLKAYADKFIFRGNQMEDQGNFEEALENYRKAIQVNPDYPRAYLNIGNAFLALDLTEEAMTNYQKSIALDPNYAFAHYNLGNAYQKIEHLEDAVSCYHRALSCNKDFPEALVAIGTTYEKLNQTEQAILQYETALKINPYLLEASVLLGDAYRKFGLLPRAVSCYRDALLLKPNRVDLHFNLGVTFLELGNYDEAILQFKKTLDLKSDHFAAIFKLGITFSNQCKFDEAQNYFQNLIDMKPDFSPAYREIGNIFFDKGQRELAIQAYQKAIDIDPENYECRVALMTSQLQGVYESDHDIDESRDRFIEKLIELENFYNQHPNIQLDPMIVGMYFPFYLAYCERDNRELLLRHGTLMTRIMEAWYEKQKFCKPNPVSRDRICIGIISSHTHEHSVWQAITKGLISKLDSAKFEIFLFGLATVRDDETIFAETCAAGFFQGNFSLRQWVEKIQYVSPDILVYPEIGMDRMTIRLACLKLAPTQIVAWGHPETTGIPAIDYYWSSEIFEPDIAERNYSEQLLTLPNLGCWYSPTNIPDIGINLLNLGIDNEIPLLLCPSTPSKYTPQYDQILIEIAKKLGDCQFIFFYHSDYRLADLTKKLASRIETSFKNAQLKFEDFFVFIPWQTKPEFHSLMKNADVMLDTVGFSGFNTVIQAIECNLPVVTMDGKYMRGRLGSGILRRIGLTELIARNQEQFVNLAVKIAQDKAYQEKIGMKMRELKHVLFEDIAPIYWLENFFIDRSAITKFVSDP